METLTQSLSKPLLQTTSSSNRIQLYNAKTIDRLPWPQTEEGDHARRFLTPFIKNGVHTYIENVRTELQVLLFRDIVLPITINHEEYDNAYVCSPYGYYISYALESLDFIDNALLKKGIRYLIKGMEKVLRWGKINKVIFVNNWLFSTNLYPELNEEMIAAITTFLRQHFPQHAIAFRSIDPRLSEKGFTALKKRKFNLIATREIFFTDATRKEIYETRIFKSDLKLLEKTDYKIIDTEQIKPSDYNKILELYQALYIHKYSALNPKLTHAFVQLAVEEKILNLKFLKKEETIDGVVGYFHRYGKIISPFFGYDTYKPQNAGLYRLLSTILMLEARDHQALFHQSAGASFYKKVRRAESSMEYTAVYTKHLPYKRRLPWFFLKSILNSVGVIFIKKY